MDQSRVMLDVRPRFRRSLLLWSLGHDAFRWSSTEIRFERDFSVAGCEASRRRSRWIALSPALCAPQMSAKQQQNRWRSRLHRCSSLELVREKTRTPVILGAEAAFNGDIHDAATIAMGGYILLALLGYILGTGYGLVVAAVLSRLAS